MGSESGHPSSWLQESIYDSSPGARSTLIVPLGLRLLGALDVGRLTAALNSVIGRHEALRTRLVATQAGLRQVVASDLEPVRLAVQEIDPGTLTEVCRSEFARPFDLHGSLLRFQLYKLGEGDHLLTMAADHTIMDGFSAQVIVSELARLYAGERLEPPALQYRDYATWERQDIAPGSLRYWTARLAAASSRLELGITPRSLNGDLRTELHELPEASHDDLAKTARRWRVPVIAVLGALMTASLRGFQAGPLPVGLFAGNRDRPGLEGTVGFVADLMPVPVPADQGEDLADLAGGFAAVLEECQEHRVPLRSVRGLLDPQPGMPLFDVTLNYLPPLTHIDRTISAGGLSFSGELLEFLYPTRLTHGWYDGAAFLDFRWRVRDGRLMGYLAANGPGVLAPAAREIAERTRKLISTAVAPAG
jgi:hypothetical protein